MITVAVYVSLLAATARSPLLSPAMASGGDGRRRTSAGPRDHEPLPGLQERDPRARDRHRRGRGLDAQDLRRARRAGGAAVDRRRLVRVDARDRAAPHRPARGAPQRSSSAARSTAAPARPRRRRSGCRSSPSPAPATSTARSATSTTRTTTRSTWSARTSGASSTTWAPITAASSTSSTSPAASRRCTRTCSTSSSWRATAGIHRVTVCSNGIRLARDEELVARLGALGARIALSFDTFEPDADVALQGAQLLATKLRCLDLLREARRRHHAHPGDDPRGERSRDRRASSSSRSRAPTSATSRSTP